VVVAFAILTSFLFGAADQYLGSVVTLGPWAVAVSTMSAPWLVLPFLVGTTRRTAQQGALIGLAATGAALIGYFAMTLSPIEGVTLSQIDLPRFAVSQTRNIVGGLITGPLFGLFGFRWRAQRSWIGALVIAAALCLEPLAHVVTGNSAAQPPPVWIGEIAVGLATGGALWRQRRSGRAG
jgi:hypothetical protein